jgi:hypothetical protein
VKLTVETIKALNPCKSRLDNFTQHYPAFKGDLIDFLSLEQITPQDKVWVAVKIVPRQILEVFAIDCAFSAQKYSDADAADAAADAAAYAAEATADAAAEAAAYAAADAAAYAAARNQERENQVDALIHLCKGL